MEYDRFLIDNIYSEILFVSFGFGGNGVTPWWITKKTRNKKFGFD